MLALQSRKIKYNFKIIYLKNKNNFPESWNIMFNHNFTTLT